VTAQRRGIAQWVLVMAAWTLYALFDAAQSWTADSAVNDLEPMYVYAIIIVPDAVVFWTPFTLAFLALARRLPLGYELWPWGAIKLVAATLLALCVRGLYSWSLNPVLKNVAPTWFEPLPPLPAGMIHAVYPEHMKVLLVIGLCMAWVQIRRMHANRLHIAELETRLTRARLDALGAQLNPHFLFNALNSIAELLHRDARTAVGMIHALSALLRFSLANREHEIRVDDEVALAQRFLAIEEIRYGDRLGVSWSIAPDVADALVPALVLQPLVENAVKHGVTRRRGAGVVSIAIARSGDMLAIEVGNALPPASAPPARGHGVGLANTRDRLSCLYDEDWSLALHTRGDTCVVRVELPLRRAPAA
jgi:signal transduction histidine kinase